MSKPPTWDWIARPSEWTKFIRNNASLALGRRYLNMVRQEGAPCTMAQEHASPAARLGMGAVLFFVAGALCLAILLLLGSNRAFGAVPSGSNEVLNSATSATAPASLSPTAPGSTTASATVNQVAQSGPAAVVASPAGTNGPVGHALARTSQSLNPLTGPAVEALAPAEQALAPVTENLVQTTESLVPPTSQVGQALAPVTKVLAALMPSTQAPDGPGAQVGQTPQPGNETPRATSSAGQTPSATTLGQDTGSVPPAEAPVPDAADLTKTGQIAQDAANGVTPYVPSRPLLVNEPSAQTASVARGALFVSRSSLTEGLLHPGVLTSSSGAGAPNPGSPVPVPPVPGAPVGPAAPTSGGGESATSSSGGHGPLMGFQMPFARPDEPGSRRLQPGAAGLPPSIVLSLLEAPG
jgi:hypothetical protein